MRFFLYRGVIHHNINALSEVLEELRDGVGVSHVALPGVMAVARQRQHGIGRGLDVASVGDEDAAASLRQRFCHGRTDAAAAAGDDCELAL